MRRIAIINQKGGVGKTTTAVNLGAALAREGRRVLVVDLDPQANASLHLGAELGQDEVSIYGVLCAGVPLEAALRPTSTPGLSIVPAHIDLSGAELELASAIGRETLLRDSIADWARAGLQKSGEPPVDYLLFDCPPSLGLLSVNGLAAAEEVLVVLQTEFFALQGLSKLIEVVQLLQRRLNPELRLAGVLPCLYDSRLRLAREVLAEIRRHFADQVYRSPIRSNVKLAEAPSHGLTIFEYDPRSSGARDYAALALELLAQELAPEVADDVPAQSPRAPQSPPTPPEPAEPPAVQVEQAAALQQRLASMSREQAQVDGTTTVLVEAEPEPQPAPDPAVAPPETAIEETPEPSPDPGALAQVEIPRPEPEPEPAEEAPPMTGRPSNQPTGALRPRTQGDYTGEDGGHLRSRLGPWTGRDQG
jgi:chromosome partitioning protein